MIEELAYYLSSGGWTFEKLVIYYDREDSLWTMDLEIWDPKGRRHSFTSQAQGYTICGTELATKVKKVVD